MLRQTLRALSAQTWADLEIIVSDNGSGDNTPDVVAEMADHRIRFRANASTLAAPSHFNQLIAEARGEFFILVSDDDLVSPDFVEGLVAAHTANPLVRVTLPRCEIIDINGIVMSRLPVPTWRVMEGQEFLLDWLWSRVPLPVTTFVTVCARKRDLEAVGGNPEFVDGSNADNACFMALALRGAVCFAPSAVLRYRVYPTSFGLSVPPERLALSANQFRRHLSSNGPISEGLNALDKSTRRRLQKGVCALLARQYLGRLETVYLARLGYRGVLRAAFSYGFDVAYLRQLPRFAARLLLAAFARSPVLPV
jgi:glycosyltransferase involved in cell wall biosynthesis